MNNKLKKVTLLLGDILILYTSLYLALLIRYRELPSLGSWQQHFGAFSVIFIAWILIFYISDLYNLHLAVNNAKFFRSTFRSIGIAGLLSAVFFYANPHIGIAPKTNLLIYLVVVSLLFLLWRRFYNWLIHSYTPKNLIAFIGYNNKVKELLETFKDKPHLGYRGALIVAETAPPGAGSIPVITDIGNLKNAIKENNISTIVISSDPHSSPELRASLFSCLPYKIRFISLPQFYEHITGKVPIDEINQMWFLENLNESDKSLFDFIKRGYDLILAISILLITALSWPLISLMIKLESRGPVFFTQERVGRNNKIFRLVKFRSMREENNDRSLTLKDDSRVTRFGNFMRTTRLDEIPQVLNIIFGDMSFIGPRPEQPKIANNLEKEIPFYNERLLVKPGATGWDQVSGEYHSPTREDTLKKLQYDLFYIKNRSLYLDISIILKTIATILRRGGV